MAHEESAVHHISLEAQDEAVKRFFLAMPTDPRGAVVELNGQAVACVLPIGEARDDNAEWTEAKNTRRCDLIDKEIESALTSAETVELHRLQEEMLRYRRRVAPLPLTEARKLHQELLKKAARAHRKD
jgi:hypothetical protein